MCDALLHKVHCSPFCTIFLLSVRFKGHLSLVCSVALSLSALLFAASCKVLSFPSSFPLPLVSSPLIFLCFRFLR